MKYVEIRPDSSEKLQKNFGFPSSFVTFRNRSTTISQNKNRKKGSGGKTAVAVKKKERIWKRGKNLVPKLSNILDMKEGGTTKWWEWNYLLSLLTLVLRVKPKNLDHERNTLHFSRYFCRIFLNFLSNFV